MEGGPGSPEISPVVPVWPVPCSLRRSVLTTSATSGTTPRVLRRYANRKIYDPYQSRYVNHSDIAELVRSGSDVRVLDSRTDRDVTGLALARILSIEENRAEGARAEALFGLLRSASGEAPPAAVERGGRRAPPEAAQSYSVVDTLLAQGQRGAFVARGWLLAQREALGALEVRARERGEVAADALAELLAVKGQLERIARRLDQVQDRLSEGEGA